MCDNLAAGREQRPFQYPPPFFKRVGDNESEDSVCVRVCTDRCKGGGNARGGMGW